MPSPYLTRRLRSYDEANAAQHERRPQDGQNEDSWQALPPVSGGAGPQGPERGERQAA